jgi:hypothetical protein
MPKTDDRPVPFTEQLILKESQLRRVQALKEARGVLISAQMFGSTSPEAEPLIQVAEWILEG